MRFSQYFNNWLYGENGYYSAFKTIGKKGDFYTSVSASKYFGGAIAYHIVQKIKNSYCSKNCMILEIGAHQGYLLADIIQFIYTLSPELLKTLKFGIVEKFDLLQDIQKSYFKDSFGDVIELNFYKDLKEVKQECGFIVANEIFDAFSCELINKNQQAYIKDNQIEWRDGLDSFVEKIAKKYNILKGEIGLGYEDFAKDMAKAFKKCEFITFDYGDINPRNDISLRVYKDHKTYPIFDIELENFYSNSDITYDVNFSHLIDAFKQNGFKLEQYATQMVGLNDLGLLEILEILKNSVEYKTYLSEIAKIKPLIDPSIFGERFKMIRVTL